MCKPKPVPTELKPMIQDSLNKRESERLVAELNKGDTLRVRFAEGIDTAQQESLTTHLESGLVPITSTSSICVDGRYTYEQSEGELGRAGADLGLSLALLARGYSPEDAFQLVYDFRFSRGEKYGWHDDSHANIDDKVEASVGAHGDRLNTGCGHCTLNIQLAKEYGVDADEVLRLRQLIVTTQNNPATKDNMRFDTLHGDHDEAGVMLINDERITLKHLVQVDEKTQSQFFVYDVARDMRLIEDLADFIAITNEGIDAGKLAEELKAEVEKHTNITVGQLKKPEDPIYNISVRVDEQTDQPYLWVEVAKK